MPIIPTENAVEKEQAKAELASQSDPIETATTEEAIRSPISGLVLVPAIRFDGDSTMPPWNWPEGEIFDWLTEAQIMPGDATFSAKSGRFSAFSSSPDGEIRSLLVRFVKGGNEHVLSTWGTEFCFQDENDLAAREMAAYEAAKAFGCEDLVLPCCLRDLSVIDVTSGSGIQSIAKELKIAPNAVEETLGGTAIVSYIPNNFDNFSEKWATLGMTNKQRWDSASDELRYSLYRTYILDFVLGTPLRPIQSLGYNSTADKVIVFDLGVSFPHAGFSAEKYAQMRLMGWGRSADGGVSRFVDNTPPTAYDLYSIFEGLDDKYVDEFVMTTEQMTARVKDDLCDRLALTLIEGDVLDECVASMFLRLAYMAFAPGSVVKRPIEFVRNFCLPVRSGLGQDNDRIIEALDYVNNIMTVVTGEPYDVISVLTQELPDLAEMPI